MVLDLNSDSRNMNLYSDVFDSKVLKLISWSHVHKENKYNFWTL